MFEIGDRSRNDRLRNSQAPRGLSHALPFYDGEQNVKVPQLDAAANAVGPIHGESPYSSGSIGLFYNRAIQLSSKMILLSSASVSCRAAITFARSGIPTPEAGARHMTKLSRRQFTHFAAGAVVLPAIARIARAQTYPSRPVRVIVGQAAGSGTDTVARLVGQY